MSAASTASEQVRELGRPGRRVLGVSEYGDADGFPAIACHGIPGTRLMIQKAGDRLLSRIELEKQNVQCHGNDGLDEYQHQ